MPHMDQNSCKCFSYKSKIGGIINVIADASLGLREESSENKLGVALWLGGGGGGGGGGGAEVLLLEPSAGIPALGALDAMLAL